MRLRFAPLLLCLSFWPLRALADAAPPTIWPASVAGERLDPQKRTDFPVSLCCDARGDVWMGTEDSGCFRWSAAESKWTQFTTKDGLGDDFVYALTTDRAGRIWAGHLRSGVSVFDGEKWRNYGALDGPLGERVFAIATSPVDGDVWIGTDAGLSRYSLKTDSWRNYSRAHGLVSDQISCLSFDSVGNLYGGTQTDGLIVGRAEGDFARFENVRGDGEMPDQSAGEGLPSNLINDVLVADDDTIYVATPNGLARSKDFGENWTFLRGGDWKAKLAGQYRPIKPREAAENLNRELLREDYVTNLAEDERGMLWMGYRQKGFEVRRPLSDRIAWISAKKDTDRFPYASTLLPLGDGRTLIASYGEGLTLAPAIPDFVPTEIEKEEAAKRRGWKQIAPPPSKPALPSPAAPPTEKDLLAISARLRAALPNFAPVGEAAFESDDWTTQGDWTGRYGSRNTVLCASGSPFDHDFVNDPSYEVTGFIGPHATKDDALRHWVHWKQTKDERVLYNPLTGYRRQAEWDDHGEDYPMSHNGPDVWVRVVVPAGWHRLAFHIFNKDGHHGYNRARDYLIEVKYGQAKTAAEANELPTQATARVRDFWGGVYKRFTLAGPGTFWVKVGKNHSFNTIVGGVFLDKVSGIPTPFEKRRTPLLAGGNFDWPIAPPLPTASATERAALDLWRSLDELAPCQGAENWQSARLLCYRALSAGGWGQVKPSLAQRERGADPTRQTILRRWRRTIPLWTPADRLEWQQEIEIARAVAVRNNPFLTQQPY